MSANLISLAEFVQPFIPLIVMEVEDKASCVKERVYNLLPRLQCAGHRNDTEIVNAILDDIKRELFGRSS